MLSDHANFGGDHEDQGIVKMEKSAVGHPVKVLRAARNWTQGDLSRRSGVSTGCISMIERGASKGNLGTLYKLAKALGVPLRELVE